ncbi:hypothetical protein [Achromobacter piechaudii]|uniref:hypothetical protein n=1 Tax=Achromobacter piechaudii TaxID=72556 RepID=UPI003DAA098B
MDVTEIFTPSDYPTYTYVIRLGALLDDQLAGALKTRGEIISVSGPSKSGKTVLIENVAGRENIIPVTGASITRPDEVWELALEWMETPTPTSTTTTTTFNGGLTGAVKLKAGPLALEGGGSGGATRATAATSQVRQSAMQQVIREIGDSPFVLLIDDYHYMPDDVQIGVARQIKEAARQGVKIVVASVPHRSDDVVRSNPELRGRVRSIDTGLWSDDDLQRIAVKGFPEVGLNIPEDQMRTFVRESFGSPQLMQAICLQACMSSGIHQTNRVIVDRPFTAQQIQAAMRETSTRADFSSLIRTMHAGPKVRGTERKVYDFPDDTRGDVYRALLLAIRADPPRMAIDWNELSKRVNRLCSPDGPQAASLATACQQINMFARRMYPHQRVIDWVGEPDNLFTIEDPYFLFYLRWSSKLDSLAKAKAEESYSLFSEDPEPTGS